MPQEAMAALVVEPEADAADPRTAVPVASSERAGRVHLFPTPSLDARIQLRLRPVVTRAGGGGGRFGGSS